MNVSHLVTRPLITVKANSTILAAAKIMVQNNVGLLVVTRDDTGANLVGVVSERDVIGAIAAGRALETPAVEVCIKQVVTVRADSEVAEAAKAMNKHGIRHVVVVDVTGKPQGVVSMRDLVGERATLAAILQSNEKEIFHGAD